MISCDILANSTKIYTIHVLGSEPYTLLPVDRYTSTMDGYPKKQYGEV
jgi:hypothetical protein